MSIIAGESIICSNINEKIINNIKDDLEKNNYLIINDLEIENRQYNFDIINQNKIFIYISDNKKEINTLFINELLTKKDKENKFAIYIDNFLSMYPLNNFSFYLYQNNNLNVKFTCIVDNISDIENIYGKENYMCNYIYYCFDTYYFFI